MTEENDPIAEKLKDALYTGRTEYHPQPPGMTEGEWDTYLRLRTIHENYVRNDVRMDTLLSRNNKSGNIQPQANYESIDFLDDESREVLDFVKALGFDPDTVQSMDIQIRPGQPVVCKAEVLPVAQRRTGSVWRSA